jgi:hypothetical protein
MLVGAGGMAASAALTYDQETTDTTSTSDLADGDAVSELDNSSKYKTIQVISGNATTSGLANPEEAFTLELTVNDSDSADDGRTFYVNESAFTVVDATNGHYSINVSHADMFAELERGLDENVTVDVTTTFNESESDEESATIQITADNGDERVVEVVSSSDTNGSDDVGVMNESSFFFDDTQYAQAEGTHSIENNTTVTYVFADSDVSEQYVNGYDSGSTSLGDYVGGMTASINGEPVAVFDGEVGETKEPGLLSGGFTEDDSYAVFSLNGDKFTDSATLEIVPRGDDADESSIDVETKGNKSLGYWSALANFGGDAASAAGWGTGA